MEVLTTVRANIEGGITHESHIAHFLCAMKIGNSIGFTSQAAANITPYGMWDNFWFLERSMVYICVFVWRSRENPLGN